MQRDAIRDAPEEVAFRQRSVTVIGSIGVSRSTTRDDRLTCRWRIGLRLPKNVVQLQRLLVEAGSLTTDEAVRGLREHGVVMSLATLDRVLDRFSAYFVVDGDVITEAVARLDATSAPDEDGPTIWSRLLERTASDVRAWSAGWVTDTTLSLYGAFSGDLELTAPPPDELRDGVLVLHHEQHQIIRARWPDVRIADIGLLALLARPELTGGSIADLLDGDPPSASMLARLVDQLIDELGTSRTTDLVVGLLRLAEDPLGDVIPASRCTGEVIEHLTLATDPLIEVSDDGPTVSGGSVQAVEDGLRTLAERHSGFRRREGQEQMARTVADALDIGGRVAVEAPTGTGKSFAYLLAAAGLARRADRPVIVATHTKVLQQQLRDDATTLRDLGLLGVPFRQIEGISNYVCAREVAESLAAEPSSAAEELVATAVAARHLQVGSGRWADVGDGMQRRRRPYRIARRSLSTTSDECEREHCDYARVCPMLRQREGMSQHAGIVAGNHALLAHWVRNAAENDERRAGFDGRTGSGAGEPEPRASNGTHLMAPGVASLVLDEAHTLEDSLTSAWTTDTGSVWLTATIRRATARRGPLRAVRRLTSGLDAEVGAVRAALQEAWTAIAGLHDPVLTYLREYTAEDGSALALTAGVVRGRPEFRDVTVATNVAVAALERLQRELGALREAVEGVEVPPGLHGRRPRTRQRIWGYELLVSKHASMLRALADLPTSLDSVYLLMAEEDRGDGEDWRFEIVPLSVAAPFRQQVVGRARAVVLTSATLTVQNSFSFLGRRLGIRVADGAAEDEGAFHGRRVASPFDFGTSATLVLTNHLPIPVGANEAEFIEEAATELIGLSSLTRGRMLALFASRRRMEGVADRWREHEEALAARGVQLLVQGQIGPRELRRTFREEPGAVAFGLRSYWEGFDAPGETLSFLALEKVPYPYLGDPLIQARSQAVADAGGDPFLDYLVPMAAIQFVQGFGRLIRSETDRGAAFVLDPRLSTVSQGAQIVLDSLPDGVRIEHALDRDDAWTKLITFVDGAAPDLSDALVVDFDDVAVQLRHLRELCSRDPEAALVEGARTLFGIDQLHPEQLELMLAVFEGRDSLGVLPTGFGKSLTFQLPALVRPDDRPTIVVSPLIALMKDQVDQLRGRRRLREVQSMSGTTSAAERSVVQQRVADGQIRLLYVSPERLVRGPELLHALDRATPAAVVVDEAHCISSWGFDFRPEYRQIAKAVTSIERVPRAALTATATDAVRQDITASLEQLDPVVVARPSDRPNLRFWVTRVGKGQNVERDRMFETLRFVLSQGTRPGVVYVQTRATAEHVALLLRAAGITARHYHAGLVPEQRASVQEQFMVGMVQVIVATNAFGMGVDKSDIGWIVHYELPRSLEAYAQETGRAARDPQLVGDCLLLYADRDIVRMRRLISRDDPAALVTRARSVLAAIDDLPRRGTDALLDPQSLTDAFDIEVDELNLSIAWLERAGALERGLDAVTRLVVDVGRREPDDPMERRRFRSFVWSQLGAKQGQQKRIVVDEFAERHGLDPDELVTQLIEWGLDRLLGVRVSARAWRVRVTGDLHEGHLVELVRSWQAQQRDAFDRAVRFAQRSADCRRETLGDYFGHAVAACRERTPEATACDVCAGTAPPWHGLPLERVPEPEHLIDVRAVALKAVGWASRSGTVSYARLGLTLALLGNDTYPNSGVPLGRGLLSCPQFGALRYLRGAARRLDDAIDALTREGLIESVEVQRATTAYASLRLTDRGRDLLGYERVAS